MPADIPEVRLLLAASHDPAGTKLGGRPEWVQSEWQPECCGQAMAFLAQIDSLDAPEARLPDSGIVYVFYCRKCFEVTSQLQCC